MCGEVQRGVQHPGNPQVVDVAAVAERQFLAWYRMPLVPMPPGRFRDAAWPWATASMASSTFT
jgi:hypothetical protein